MDLQRRPKNQFTKKMNEKLNEKRVLGLLGDAGTGKSYYAKQIIKLNPNPTPCDMPEPVASLSDSNKVYNVAVE